MKRLPLSPITSHDEKHPDIRNRRPSPHPSRLVARVYFQRCRWRAQRRLHHTFGTQTRVPFFYFFFRFCASAISFIPISAQISSRLKRKFISASGHIRSDGSFPASVDVIHRFAILSLPVSVFDHCTKSLQRCQTCGWYVGDPIRLEQSS